MTGSLRRALMIALLVAVLVAVGITDRLEARTTTPVAAPSSDALSVLRMTRSAHTESSAWFCAGGTGAQGGAPATIVLTNGGGRPVHGTLTAVSASASAASGSGPWAGARSVAVTVPADGQAALGAQQLGTTDWVAAAVVLDGGGVAVSESVQSPLGWSMAPCAPSTAANWYFAHGVTSQGGGLILSLFNPDATDAIVERLAGVLHRGLPGSGRLSGHRRAPRVGGDREHRRPRPLRRAPSPPRSRHCRGPSWPPRCSRWGRRGTGASRSPSGAPATSSRWVFPQSTGIPGGTVAFHVFNPTSTPANGVGRHRVVPGRRGRTPGHAHSGAVLGHAERRGPDPDPHRRALLAHLHEHRDRHRGEPGGERAVRIARAGSPRSATPRACPGGTGAGCCPPWWRRAPRRGRWPSSISGPGPPPSRSPRRADGAAAANPCGTWALRRPSSSGRMRVRPSVPFPSKSSPTNRWRWSSTWCPWRSPGWSWCRPSLPAERSRTPA